MNKRDLKEDLEYCKELEPISLKIKRHLIVALGRRAKGVNVLERWTLNAIDGWPYAIRQALEEKERADKYEALVREQENQIDILSTTLAMYCTPYYDMQERALKAERANKLLCELIAETADLLEELYPKEALIVGRLRRLPEMIERIVERGAEDEVDSR